MMLNGGFCGSYRAYVEERLRMGHVAVVDLDRRRTGYLYHSKEKPAYYITVRDKSGRGTDWLSPRIAGAHRRDEYFEECEVTPKKPSEVAGPVAALVREANGDGAGGEEYEEVEENQRQLDSW